MSAEPASEPDDVVDMLDAALAHAKRGLPVFPCNPSTKRPLTANGFEDASNDDQTIRGWWSRWPGAMIGVPTGEASRSWVLDVDDPELFERSCPIDLPATRRCGTGKGYHLYFRHDPAKPVRNAQRNVKGWPFPDMPGAEVRGEGGYVIVPPSLHPSGRRYVWEVDTPSAEAPPALLSIVRKSERQRTSNPQPGAGAEPGTDTPYGLAALDGECEAILSAGNGAQEQTLNAAGLKIGALCAGKQLSLQTARARLIAAALAMPSYNDRDPWLPEKVVSKLERALSDGAANPRTAPERMMFGKARLREVRQDGFDPDSGEVYDEPGEDTPGSNKPALAVSLWDFYAYMPAHTYIFAPSGEFWPGTSVNSRIPPIPLVDRKGDPVLDKKGEQVFQNANAWLDQQRPVEQMTWAPGHPQVVRDRLISDGGWIVRPECSVFNQYRPPVKIVGDAQQAGPWLDHVRRVYPDDAEHLIRWLAHRVQKPEQKINHAIVMGGAQGIGKDTILEPVKAAIGPWNFAEVSPQHLLGRFNGFVKSVILRVSEARDLGDIDRFAFYDHMKTYTAAPPDVLRVDEKHLREHSVFNVCGVIITTNHKTDGIYLPADDRRHYVAWSSTRGAFDGDYWTKLYGWYAGGGIGHVVAYLSALPLDGFDAKAPPPKTAAFWDIVSSNQAPEDAELADALDLLGWPPAVTIGRIAGSASVGFSEWLLDRKNSRRIPHRLEECGYVAVRNDAAKDGLFKVAGKRCGIYAKKTLSVRDAIAAAEALTSR